MAELKPAQGLTARASSQSSIKVKWERPQDDRAYFFRLYMRKAGDDAWTRAAQDKDLMDFEVKQLEPATEYEFRVQAYSNHAEGPFTAPVSSKTSAGAPLKPPPNLREVATETDSITVSWDKYDPSTGSIDGVYLYLDEEGKDTFVEVELDAETTKYQAKYLNKDTVYRFQICSFNVAGESPMSEILHVATRQDARSRFLQRGKGSERQLLSGSKRHTIRDVPAARPNEPVLQPTEETTPATPKSRTPSGRVPAKWRPPYTGQPAPPKEETKEEREARERKEQQQAQLDKVRSLRSAFEDTLKETELEAKLRQRSIKIKADTRNLVSGGTHHSSSDEETYAQQREKERQFFEEQLKKEEADDDLEAHLQALAGSKSLKSMSGTIRGKKNAVRAVLGTFTQSSKFESELLEQLYNEEKNNTIVLYITSVAAVRQRFDECNTMLKIFENHQKKVRVKDISMDARFNQELMERLPAADGVVPQAFVNYFHIGGLDRVMALNETGQLGKMLKGFENRNPVPCSKCGGVGFINCGWCFGSKKSITNKYGAGDVERNLKCTVCNENGLQRCDAC